MGILILEHPRIHSPKHFNDIANTPLGSCLMAGYTCAALRGSGFGADILDARFLTFSEMEAAVLDESPEWLLVHAVYFWEHTQRLFDALDRLKRAGLAGKIILFGYFPSLCWTDLLTAFPQVDGVIVGEPEMTAVDLAGQPVQGPLRALPGLAVRDLFGIPVCRPRPLIQDLDHLPEPVRPALAFETTVNIQASRGCYNGCNFCLVPALNNGKTPWRGRSAASIADEIARLKSQGITDFYFVDPNFIGPGTKGRQRALDLARALAPLDITFGMETRSADIDGDLMKALTDAGLKSLLLGLESGSRNVLNRIGKNSTPDRNLAAIDAVRRAGLEPEIGFIMFERGSSLDDIRENFEFLKQARLLDRLSRTANILYHHQIALKGTRLYQQAAENGWLTPEGLVEFEGILTYQDPRVARLAENTRRRCHQVLQAMGDPDSDLYWGRETIHGEPYAKQNRALVDQFSNLLETAS